VTDDPARRAAAAPESPDPTSPVHAVGVGPGDPTFLTDRARSLLEGADVLVGFASVVDVVRDRTDARLLACGYDDQSARLTAFADCVAGGADGVAALMGDPNVSGYQFLGRVEAAIEAPVRVVPGVSAVQVAAGRARTPLEQSTVVSLHRRGSLEGPFDRLAAVAPHDHLLVLPRPYDCMPADVATRLVDVGIDPDREALVLERLTLPAESVTRTTVGALADSDAAFSDLSVLAVRTAEPTPVTPGGPEASP
jgi:cobalt-precorrin-7 (C5)-methyltransferase